VEIPKRVKIGPYWWTVELVDELTHDADRNKNLFGQCREGEQKIVINKSLNPDGHFAAFMHELAHAIDFVMMAGLKEKQIDRMATGLAMVLRDNDLWRWRGESHPVAKEAGADES